MKKSVLCFIPYFRSWNIHNKEFLFFRIKHVYTDYLTDGEKFYTELCMEVDLKEAGKVFAEWVGAVGTTYSAFAGDVPCSTNYPSMWASGAARPSYRMACRIEELTNGLVPRTTWYPAPEPRVIENPTGFDIGEL